MVSRGECHVGARSRRAVQTFYEPLSPFFDPFLRVLFSPITILLLAAVFLVVLAQVLGRPNRDAMERLRQQHAAEKKRALLESLKSSTPPPQEDDKKKK